MDEESPPADRRRHFEILSVPIVAASTGIFTWYLTLGRANLLGRRTYSNFFDLQARAMFQGRFYVRPGSMGFDGFVHRGRTYTYFGIFPSLLRAPVLLLTNKYDGRLTSLSMLAAYLVAMTSAVMLIGRIRRLCGRRAWSTPGLVVALVVVGVVGVGSNLMFLAAGAWVFHEAELWGAAAVLASFAALARYLERDLFRDIVVAAFWGTAAWLSRGSVGLAPTAALSTLALVRLFPNRWLTPFGPPPARVGVAWSPHRRRAFQLAAAAVLPLALFSAVNMAKFDSLTTVPFREQIGFHMFPGGMRTLDKYGGNLFSLRLVPGALLQAIRPDLVKPVGQWPFVAFTRHDAITFGGATFGNVEPSAGFTTTHPALIVLGAIGCVAIMRRRRRDRPGDLAFLRPFLLGGAAAAAVPLTIAFIAQRYWTDALPLLVVAAAAGVSVVDQWATDRSHGRARLAAIGLCAVSILAAAGMFVVLSSSWLFQRFVIPPDQTARLAALRTQVAVAQALHTPAVPVRRVAALPRVHVPGAVVVVGRCAGLYYGQDDGWALLESASPANHYRLRARWPRRLPGRPLSPLLALAGDSPYPVVALRGIDDRRVQLVVVGGDRRQQVAGPPVVAAPGVWHTIVVDTDPARGDVSVRFDGRSITVRFRPPTVPIQSQVGESLLDMATARQFPGSVTTTPAPTPTCDALISGDAAR